MPSLQSLVRIILAVMVAGLFYFASRSTVVVRPEGLAMLPSQIVELTLALGDDDSVTVVRDGDSDWRFSRDRGLEPEQMFILNFLLALARAEWSPVEAELEPVMGTVVLSDGLNRQTLELGSRIEPFLRQLVKLDGVVYEVSEDLSATLGLWAGLDQPNLVSLHDLILYQLPEQDVIEIERTSRLVDYRYTARPEPGGYSWSLDGSRDGYELDAQNLESYRQSLSRLVVNRPASLTERTGHDYPYRLVLTTDQGTRLHLQVTGMLDGDDREHIVQMTAPREGAAFIDNRTFRRLMTPTQSLIRNLPAVEFDPGRAVAVMAARDGMQLQMRRGNQQWQMIRPVQSTNWLTLEDEPGRRPSNAAREYLETLGSLQSRESFVLSEANQERRQIYREAFENPSARVRVDMTDGSSMNYLLSARIPGSDYKILRVNGKDLIVNASLELSLVPPINQLLENP